MEVKEPISQQRQHSEQTPQLARRIGVHERVVRRMLDPKHATKAEKIQAALGQTDDRGSAGRSVAFFGRFPNSQPQAPPGLITPSEIPVITRPMHNTTPAEKTGTNRNTGCVFALELSGRRSFA